MSTPAPTACIPSSATPSRRWRRHSPVFQSDSAPTADAPASLAALARGVSTLSAAEAIRVAVSAALAIYLARRLGAAAFGMWTFALAVAGYPLSLVEAG